MFDDHHLQHSQDHKPFTWLKRKLESSIAGAQKKERSIHSETWLGDSNPNRCRHKPTFALNERPIQLLLFYFASQNIFCQSTAHSFDWACFGTIDWAFIWTMRRYFIWYFFFWKFSRYFSFCCKSLSPTLFMWHKMP